MKYLLDTNVLSEFWKKAPSSTVKDWLDKHESECGIPSPVIAEIADGVYATTGIKHEELVKKLDQLIKYWANAFVPFDDLAALDLGQLQHSPEYKRQPRALWDLLIASIARTRGLAVVTRNVSDFPDVATVNPWES